MAFELDSYQALADRTANKDLDKDDALLCALMGLSGEAGEALDIMKKALFQGHELDDAKLLNEAGDILWYLALLATALGVPLSEIAERNIAKLKARYKDGFTSAESIHRDPNVDPLKLQDALHAGETKPVAGFPPLRVTETDTLTVEYVRLPVVDASLRHLVRFKTPIETGWAEDALSVWKVSPNSSNAVETTLEAHFKQKWDRMCEDNGVGRSPFAHVVKVKLVECEIVPKGERAELIERVNRQAKQLSAGKCEITDFTK